MTKVNRTNISEHLFEYQLSLIGKTVKDAIHAGDWKNQWYFNQEHADKLRAYAVPLIKKTFKCNKSKAEAIFNWFLLNFGLRIY